MSSYMKAGYTPPQPPKSPKKKKRKAPYQGGQGQNAHNGAGEKRPKRPPKAPKTKRPPGVRILIALVCTLALAVICMLAFVIVAFEELHAYEDCFYPGVYVGGVHLGGLTTQQAATALQPQTDEALQSYSVDIISESGQTIKTLMPEDISLRYDLSAQLDAAWSVGRSGNLIERFQTVRALREEPKTFDWTYAYDEQRLMEFVNALGEQIDCAAQDAQPSFFPDSAAPFAFTQEQTGAWLDRDALFALLQAQLSNLETQNVLMPVVTQTPSITREELTQNVSLRARVKSQTAAEDDENRRANIRIAVERLNGRIVKPGETLDFNAVIEKRTIENGYAEAPEIAYGEAVSGIGGGVCQVATALYQAALCARVDVAERHPHVFPAYYAPAGQEATVSDQGLNLILRNQTGYPLYIKARCFDGEDGGMQIEITIFGAPLGQMYALESVVTQTIEIPEAVRIRDKESVYVRYTDEEEQVSDGREGCVAETYLVEYKDGEAGERTLVHTDTYQAVAPRIYVGTLVRDEAQGN